MELEVELSEKKDGKKEEKKEYGKYDKWEIESAARTLVEAEEIKADAEKMKYVKLCMEKKHTTEKKVISSLEELRAAAKGSEEDESEG
jgi:ribosomal protein L14E/L6E/L27E